MAAIELLAPILDGGIRFTNFFNGRLPTGEDMVGEQEGNREARNRLGIGIGNGVAYGLEVSEFPGAGKEARVKVESGLAINRCGEALRLQTQLELSLVQPSNG